MLYVSQMFQTVPISILCVCVFNRKFKPCKNKFQISVALHNKGLFLSSHFMISWVMGSWKEKGTLLKQLFRVLFCFILSFHHLQLQHWTSNFVAEWRDRWWIVSERFLCVIPGSSILYFYSDFVDWNSGTWFQSNQKKSALYLCVLKEERVR